MIQKLFLSSILFSFTLCLTTPMLGMQVMARNLVRSGAVSRNLVRPSAAVAILPRAMLLSRAQSAMSDATIKELESHITSPQFTEKLEHTVKDSEGLVKLLRGVQSSSRVFESEKTKDWRDMRSDLKNLTIESSKAFLGGACIGGTCHLIHPELFLPVIFLSIVAMFTGWAGTTIGGTLYIPASMAHAYSKMHDRRQPHIKIANQNLRHLQLLIEQTQKNERS
jgi:hypothetical protein